MNWKLVYFGKVTPSDVKKYVADPDWQRTRLAMKGTSLLFKYNTLVQWLESNEYSEAAKVQVTNYVTALSRGGLIKPSDYR